tara:strand:+ start:260 stop:451 length:192 start_codon:yes stop_codon:yes gene_type:complete
MSIQDDLQRIARIEADAGVPQAHIDAFWKELEELERVNMPKDVEKVEEVVNYPQPLEWWTAVW